MIWGPIKNFRSPLTRPDSPATLGPVSEQPPTLKTVRKPAYDELTEHQRHLLDKYEMDYHTASAEDLLRLPPSPNISLLGNPSIGGSLNTQAIAENRGLDPKHPLSAEQLAAANVLLDFSDSRSQAAKLRSMGIPTTKYNNWLKNPHFARYLRTRAEDLISDTQHEAHTALLRNIQRGNQRSIEYYNEMTGRYNPKAESTMNVTLILVRLVEVIQRHVKDPDVIKAIAAEFNEVLPSAVDGGVNGNVANAPAIGQ